MGWKNPYLVCSCCFVIFLNLSIILIWFHFTNSFSQCIDFHSTYICLFCFESNHSFSEFSKVQIIGSKVLYNHMITRYNEILFLHTDQQDYCDTLVQSPVKFRMHRNNPLTPYARVARFWSHFQSPNYSLPSRPVAGLSLSDSFREPLPLPLAWPSSTFEGDLEGAEGKNPCSSPQPFI